MVFILYLLNLSIDFKGFVNDQNIVFMVSLSHVTCLETSCNSCSLKLTENINNLSQGIII
jgi:hypothetical protein